MSHDDMTKAGQLAEFDSQIVLLESLRSGIWVTQNLWVRVRTYKG